MIFELVRTLTIPVVLDTFSRPLSVQNLRFCSRIDGELGLVEETIFRGQILPALSTHWSSLPVGFVLSTLLFAALHVNPLSLFKGGEGFKDAVVLIAYQLVTGSIFAARLY